MVCGVSGVLWLPTTKDIVTICGVSVGGCCDGHGCVGSKLVGESAMVGDVVGWPWLTVANTGRDVASQAEGARGTVLVKCNGTKEDDERCMLDCELGGLVDAHCINSSGGEVVVLKPNVSEKVIPVQRA